jgi:hypothetical protein
MVCYVNCTFDPAEMQVEKEPKNSLFWVLILVPATNPW